MRGRIARCRGGGIEGDKTRLAIGTGRMIACECPCAARGFDMARQEGERRVRSALSRKDGQWRRMTGGESLQKEIMARGWVTDGRAMGEVRWAIGPGT